jgi:hypothetical protein
MRERKYSGGGREASASVLKATNNPGMIASSSSSVDLKVLNVVTRARKIRSKALSGPESDLAEPDLCQPNVKLPADDDCTMWLVRDGHL